MSRSGKVKPDPAIANAMKKIAGARPTGGPRHCWHCQSYHVETAEQCREAWAAVGETPGFWAEDYE